MMHYKKTFGDRVFDAVIGLFIILVLIITLYPLIFVISMSISDPFAAARGDVWLLPVGLDFTAIKKVLSDQQVLTYYGNTIWYTVVGTACGVVVTCLAAYPLSRPEFVHRKIIMKFIMVTMFFSGGIIPTYLVVSQFLHLYDTRWAVVILWPRSSKCWLGQGHQSVPTKSIVTAPPKENVLCPRYPCSVLGYLVPPFALVSLS